MYHSNTSKSVLLDVCMVNDVPVGRLAFIACIYVGPMHAGIHCMNLMFCFISVVLVSCILAAMISNNL